MMNAEDQAVQLKSSKDTHTKHADLAIFNDYVLNEFDRSALKIEFQDIKDRIVGLYLMANHMARSTIFNVLKFNLESTPIKLVEDIIVEYC
jgi:hypothetical protein